MSEWQPIETAPKDGTLILVYTPASKWPIRSVKWNEEFGEPGWYYVYDDCLSSRPSHWQPLPEAPK